MTIKEILSKCADFKRHEVRAIEEDYAEIVIPNEELNLWAAVLSDALGPAGKEPGARPEKEDLEITKECGGIRAEQTLFKKKFGESTIAAVFWPWQSGSYTTLKIFTA